MRTFKVWISPWVLRNEVSRSITFHRAQSANEAHEIIYPEINAVSSVSILKNMRRRHVPRFGRFSKHELMKASWESIPLGNKCFSAATDTIFGFVSDFDVSDQCCMIGKMDRYETKYLKRTTSIINFRNHSPVCHPSGIKSQIVSSVNWENEWYESPLDKNLYNLDRSEQLTTEEIGKICSVRLTLKGKLPRVHYDVVGCRKKRFF